MVNLRLVGGSIFIVVNGSGVLRPGGISVAGEPIVVVDVGVGVIASPFGESEGFLEGKILGKSSTA